MTAPKGSPCAAWPSRSASRRTPSCRCYAHRDVRLIAVADEGARLLPAAPEGAARGRINADAVRAGAAASLGFARKRPALNQVGMVEHSCAAAVRPAHAGPWDVAIGLLRNVANGELAAEAAVALWGLWHGAAGLQQVSPLDRRKPGGAIEFGLDALLEGTAHRSSARSLRARARATTGKRRHARRATTVQSGSPPPSHERGGRWSSTAGGAKPPARAR